MHQSTLLREVAAFRKARSDDLEVSGVTACLLRCGVGDPKRLETATPLELSNLAKHLRLELSRERLRGMARHRRYDLNRHIALKRTLDRVLLRAQNQNGAGAPF